LDQVGREKGTGKKMSDNDPINVSTTQAELNVVRALAEREQRTIEQRVADANEIVKVGYSRYGNQKFDEASQALANAHGGHLSPETLDALRASEMPHEAIVELADDPQRLERFAKMSPAQQRADIFQREQRKRPHAPVAPDPAWKSPVLKGGPVSDADWNSGAADRMSDKDFYKELDRRWEERAKKRGGRW
jgi:hypothetical protein